MKVKGKITDVSLDYVLHRPKITFQLENQFDLLTEEFGKLRKEESLDIDFKKIFKQRGPQANKYFHKQINQLARYERGIGHAISDDEMKVNINLQYGTIATDDDGNVIAVKVPRGTELQKAYVYAKWYKYDQRDNCDCYLLYKRTSSLNTLEMSQLIKGLDVECKKVGIKTLDDLEFEKMMRAYEKELEKE